MHIFQYRDKIKRRLLMFNGHRFRMKQTIIVFQNKSSRAQLYGIKQFVVVPHL